MKTVNKVQLNLSIPEEYRNLLRRMASERMICDPSKVVTGTSIATEMLLDALKEIAGKTERGASQHDTEGGTVK